METYRFTSPPLPAELHREIVQLSHRLARSRETLERTAVTQLQNTSSRLDVISSTTERAATSLLDGLESALAMVEALAPAEAEETRGALRDLLFDLMTHLQFQDITSQQLSHASTVLLETERSLAEIARSMELQAEDLGDEEGAEAGPGAAAAASYDPAASMDAADARQALVDELFTSAHPL